MRARQSVEIQSPVAVGVERNRIDARDGKRVGSATLRAPDVLADPRFFKAQAISQHDFREIFVDLQVLLTQGAKRAAERANARRGSWVRLPYGVREEVGRGGSRGGGLEDDRVPGREGRRDLPGQHQEREVPGNDLGCHAQGARSQARERVVQLVRPAGVVEEVGRRERDVDVSRFLDRLAGVHRLDHGEFAAALLEDAGDAVEVFRAFAAG